MHFNSCFSTATLIMTRNRFAPLGRGRVPQEKDLPELKGIIFDVDGTLCLPQNTMFERMRSALGITKNIDILDHCYSLAPLEQQDAFKKICDIEREAMKAQVPQPGLRQLMEYLEERNIPKALCTRNFDAPVTHLLQKFIPHINFAPIVTRSFKPPKPSPAGILHIAKAWGLKKKNELNEEFEDPSSIIMVGDSIDDLTAGYRAGAATVLISNDTNTHLATHKYCDLVIETLDELIEILENGFTARVRMEDRFENLS